MTDNIFSKYLTKGINTINVTEKDVFPLLKYRPSTKEIANNALNNIIIPFTNFDPVEFDENYWVTDKRKKYGDSYQLYIQSMRSCSDIMNEYIKTGDKKYLDKVEEIIYSWIDFASGDPDEKMIWYDHPTANRTQVIIEYLYHAKKSDKQIDDRLFKAVLLKHGEILSDDVKYNNNNHGLMMDKALMVLGNVLEDEFLFNKGYYRAIDTFWYSFSPNGVHLENSPDYHTMVVRMYDELEEYLNKSGKTFGDNIKGYLKLAKIYPQVLLKPDRTFPSIGDSGDGKRKFHKLYSNLYDEEAGISILQYRDPKPIYMSFVCGYSSRVHKHKDDLSITLNYNGVDFFEDPGKYNYSKSKERKYMISRRAHSSFFMKQFDYTIKPENRFDRKVKLTGYYDNKSYSLVQGENGDYDGSSAVLSRKAILFKSAPVIILVDDVDTSVRHELKFVQNFNLASSVSIEESDEGYRLTNKEEALTIKQFNVIDTNEIVAGDFEKPVAINTTGFGKAEKTNQLRFERASNKGNVYCTAIYDDRVVQNLNVTIENDLINVDIDGKAYQIHL